MKIKTCSRCKLEKDLSEFYQDKRASDKLSCHCRTCQNKATIISRNKKLEEYKLYNKNYRKIHQERYKQYYKDNLSHIKSVVLYNKFGITLEQYNNILKEQNRVCAICKCPETVYDKRIKRIKALTVDHDHKTGKVRGLLCIRCNRSIGMLKDDIEVLLSAVDYLKRHKL